MSGPDLPSEPDFSLHPDDAEARGAAERLFESVAAGLLEALPVAAEIHHVGATAVPGCLTKGDLDIVVRVAADDFIQADRVLAARFARNVGSKRTRASRRSRMTARRLISGSSSRPSAGRTTISICSSTR